MASTLSVWLPAVRAGSGADVFTERLADALRRRGVNANVTWFPHLSELVPDIWRFCRPPEGTQIIHANSAYAFAFKRHKIPLVITEHHYTLDPAYRPYTTMAQQLYHRGLVGPYMRRSYAAADAVTTDSLFTARVLAEVAGVRATRTIPLWVDYEEFSPAAVAPTEASRVPFRMLFVGNASARKGADLIAPLAHRLGAGFEIRCTGGLRHGKSEAAQDNVRPLGRLSREELVREYRSCDAVLVPSRYEGFGYAALEAMACAKPVVGFRCGAIEEVVEDGETGLLCEIDDIDMLERNCRHLAENPALAAAFGVSGRRRATWQFSERRAMDDYIDLYRSLQPRG
jgi:glycosyltransferase involved in cell wall biosynthesis